VCLPLKHRLRKLLLCLPLLLGAFVGVPMSPEEVEELMHSMNQQTIAYTIPGKNETVGGTLANQTDEEP
jgi:hypothetical protein